MRADTALNEEKIMPHRSGHHRGGGAKTKHEPVKGTARRSDKDVNVATEKMSQEFPSYEALDDGRSGGIHGEHRADTARMSRALRGGTSAKRSPDDDTGLSRGESEGSHDPEGDIEGLGRGESTGAYGSSGSLWDEADPPARGESGSSDGNLAANGFATPGRGESSGQVTEESGVVDRSGPIGRGESVGQEPTAHGGFLEPDEQGVTR
jgi:hypothetical protein